MFNGDEAVALREDIDIVDLPPSQGPPPSSPVRAGQSSWLEELNETRYNNERPRRVGVGGGKWCLFVPPEEIDENWMLIGPATRVGLLGYKSICKRNARDQYANHPYKVICVSTADCGDEEDIERVRVEIRKLVGDDHDMHYKTDRATDEKLLAIEGDRDISAYRDYGTKSRRYDPDYWELVDMSGL